MGRFVFWLLAPVLTGSIVQAQGTGQPLPGEAGARDSFTMEIVVGGIQPAGWTLRSDETGRAFDRNSPPMDEAFTADAGAFADLRARLADYRALATAGAGCPVSDRDVLAFRLVWLEQGRQFTTTFADSCGGVPTDFFDRIRPIGQRLNRFITLPQPSGATDDR